MDVFKTSIIACSKIPGLYSVINFGRRELEQTGTGHFACLGGFHPESQKVLILDTARFKYPPFWVDLESFYRSVKTKDEDSNKMRGFIVISRFKCKEKLQIKVGTVL